MLKLLQPLLVGLFLIFDRLRGKRHFFVREAQPHEISSMRSITIEQYCFTIMVTRFVYVWRFENKYLREKRFVVYRVNSSAIGQVPDKVKEICRQEYYIPKLLPGFFNETKQCEKIIDAYLELTLNKLTKKRRKT